MFGVGPELSYVLGICTLSELGLSSSPTELQNSGFFPVKRSSRQCCFSARPPTKSRYKPCLMFAWGYIHMGKAEFVISVWILPDGESKSSVVSKTEFERF